MKYDFDKILNRKNTHSYKWDQSEKFFGDKDILPLWVADMDFESPPAVKAALQSRANQGIYGYTVKSEGYIRAIVSWFQNRHQWSIDPKWLSESPGIVTSLSLAVELFSSPGAPIIVQSPVYYPFYDVTRMNTREVLDNPLEIIGGRYEINFAHLEQIMMKDEAKVMLFCSPHNPGGRVWNAEELSRLGKLCIQYGVLLISDEIHCDLVLPGHKHTPFASISEEFAQNSITLLAPTKTFNLPGLQSSFAVIPNPELKRKFEYRMKALSLHMTHYFAHDAVEAAYSEGGDWLDELIFYLKRNVDFTISYLSANLQQVEPMVPEGTYMVWVDCRGLNRTVSELKELMYRKAKVAFSEGSVFGANGEGYLRINLACPMAILREALERFCHAAKETVPDK